MPLRSYSKKEQTQWKKPKKKTKAVTPEKLIQEFCENYLNQYDIPFIRIPDEIWKNSVPEWIRKIAAKYLKGKPDLTILFTNGTYICVELKTEIGKQSKGQKDFEKLVGYDNYFIIRSHEDFKKLVRGKRC